MSWKELTQISSGLHMRTFGEDLPLKIRGVEDPIFTRVVISPHMVGNKHEHADVEGVSLIASISKEDLPSPEQFQSVVYQGVSYTKLRYKIEPDGFYVFFLVEEES